MKTNKVLKKSRDQYSKQCRNYKEGMQKVLDNQAIELDTQRERDIAAHHEKMAAEARQEREAKEREEQRKRDAIAAAKENRFLKEIILHDKAKELKEVIRAADEKKHQRALPPPKAQAPAPPSLSELKIRRDYARSKYSACDRRDEKKMEKLFK